MSSCLLCVCIVQVEWSSQKEGLQTQYIKYVVAHLILWCSGAGQVLADNVLLLRSLETLSIFDINPIPVFQALSQNAEHSVSRMGISLWKKPQLKVTGVSSEAGIGAHGLCHG